MEKKNFQPKKDSIVLYESTADKNIVDFIDFVENLQKSFKYETITEDQFVNAIESLQKCLKSKNIFTYKIFSTIIDIFKANPQLVNIYWPKVFHPMYSGLFNSLSTENETNSQIFLLTIQYLDVLMNRFLERELNVIEREFCEAVGDIIIYFHFKSPQWENNMKTPSFLMNSLQVIHKVMSSNPQYVQENASELLGLGKSYMFYGLIATERITKPQKMPASQQSLYEFSVDNIESGTRNHVGKLSKSRKPRVKKPSLQDNYVSNTLCYEDMNEFCKFDVKTSDSDASGSENGNLSNVRHRNSKVRLNAIGIIGLVTSVQDRHKLYGFWYALLPNHLIESMDNLLYTAWRDPNVRCRCAALQIITHIMFGSKKFLHQAEYPVLDNQLPFLPFSLNLGISVLNSYELLNRILGAESSTFVLSQALKCLAVLVQATNFNKFNPDLLLKFVTQVRNLLIHRDISIQVSALMVFEFLLYSVEVCDVIKSAVGLITDDPISANEPSNILVCEDILTGEKKNVENEFWLLNYILQNINSECGIPSSVLMKSLQILSTISGQINILNSFHIENVANAIKKTLYDSVSDVRLYAARCLDNWSIQMSCSLSTNYGSHKFDTFWHEMMPVVIDQFGKINNQTTIKVCLCDALSNISAVVFERMCFSKQMNVLSFLSGISSDSTEDPLVKVAAVRALAIFVNFPSLKENMVFLENVAELTLRLISDTNLLMRVKLFWSLGNISDALINAESNECVSLDLLKRLINVSLLSSSDNDKIRCNSVRALGNLLRLITKEHLSKPDCSILFQKIVHALIDSLRSPGNAKVKWNVCYALCNIMKHPQCLDFEWQDNLYPILCNVIVHHSNFKVRINATSVILAGNRKHYGQYFEIIWVALINSIEQTMNLQNFYEYNHRDNLQEQLCLTISHCICSADLEDYPMLRRCLVMNVETVQCIWIRVINRILPEKAAPLLSCAPILMEKINSNMQITAPESNAIHFLKDTFSLPLS